MERDRDRGGGEGEREGRETGREERVGPGQLDMDKCSRKAGELKMMVRMVNALSVQVADGL